ncbi:MAG: hypothetical protein V4606_00275 [Patescibacteria group bacterium]
MSPSNPNWPGSHVREQVLKRLATLGTNFNPPEVVMAAPLEEPADVELLSTKSEARHGR